MAVSHRFERNRKSAGENYNHEIVKTRELSSFKLIFSFVCGNVGFEWSKFKVTTSKLITDLT